MTLRPRPLPQFVTRADRCALCTAEPPCGWRCRVRVCATAGEGRGRTAVQKPRCATGSEEQRKLLTSSWTRFLSIIGKYANERPTRSEKGKSSSKLTARTGPFPGEPWHPARPSERALGRKEAEARGWLVAAPPRPPPGGAPSPPPPPLEPRGSCLRAPRCGGFRRLLQACRTAGSLRAGPAAPSPRPRAREAPRGRVLSGSPGLRVERPALFPAARRRGAGGSGGGGSTAGVGAPPASRLQLGARNAPARAPSLARPPGTPGRGLPPRPPALTAGVRPRPGPLAAGRSPQY